MKIPSLRWWLVAFVFCVLVAGFAFRLNLKPEYLGKVPNFSFPILPQGQTVRVDQALLKGRVWVAGFIFTSCHGICPILSAKMRDLQVSLKSEPDFALVSFSIDPERDTEEALRNFRSKWTKNPNNWYYARPDRDALAEFSRGLRLVVGEAGDFTHTARLLLIDRQSNIRGYYQGTDDDQVAKLLLDAQRALRE